ncbi:7583_t:CDS:2 [Funneliformis mosseae]|uniref:7583_t:CDS:1 n=1 Tax=Funneliformis mosseae TaxID=27381 RepID=A0A9N9FQF4_FUNMO|nr:7583_t:CDS:2 [Funneliformis mosseae]
MSDEAYSIDVLRDKKSQKSSSHNISMMKISPNGNYLITYSKKDETIVGWNVEDKNIVDGEDIKEDQFITGYELLCNFMNHHHCLLLSLFDYPLIWNSKTKCHEECFKKNNQLNKLDFELSSLPYDSESKNYRFVIINGHIQRIEYKSSELFYQQDDFSEAYKLDKGSVIWKIKIEGLEKQKFKIEETLNKEMDIYIIEYTKKFIQAISDIKKTENNLKSRIDKFEEFIKMKSLTNLGIKISKSLAKDFIERLTIIEEEKDYSNWNNKIGKLMKDFTKRINKIMELTDPNQFKIKITKTHVHVNKGLIHLFGADKYLRDEDYNGLINILAYKLLKNKEIALITKIGFFIFHLNNDEGSIFLNYFYHMYQPEKVIENISKLPGYPKVDKMYRKDISDNDELIYGWISYVKENNEEFLKYGSALLMFAIKVHDSDLIDGIYQRCLYLFNRDLESNKGFLSIINTSMPLLEKYYPEYVARYSSDTFMIIDSLEYKIEHLDTSHLYPFSNMEIVDLTPSIAWTKYTIKVDDMYYHDERRIIKSLTSYNQVLENGTIEPNSSFVQRPDLNTNMFIDYGTSLLSMYLYLTGDSNALSNWEYKNNPQLTILMVFFSLLIAVYLMNLLIGLLSNAIEEDNNRVSYFVQKAKILAEIELFYLFPNQRRKKTWFPDVIYYHADVDETRRKIKELIKAGEWNSD